MKIVVPVVIEMTDEQVKAYADEHGIGKPGFRLYTRDVVEDVRNLVLAATAGLFDGVAGGATVTLKGN